MPQNHPSRNKQASKQKKIIRRPLKGCRTTTHTTTTHTTTTHTTTTHTTTTHTTATHTTAKSLSLLPDHLASREKDKSGRLVQNAPRES